MPGLHQLGPGPVITFQTWRENFTKRAVIDICRSVCPHQPQIKAESRRQGSTGRSRGGLRRPPVWSLWKRSSVCRTGLISACRVTAASPWAVHGWLSRCRGERGCCFPRWEDGSLPASWASVFFNRAPAPAPPAPRRPARADTLMMRRGTRPHALLLLLPVPDSRCYCIFIHGVCSFASSVAFLMGWAGEKRERENRL